MSERVCEINKDTFDYYSPTHESMKEELHLVSKHCIIIKWYQVFHKKA